MRSVNNKSDDLIRSTSAGFYDLIILTETWLRLEQKHKEFMSDKYKSFRKDRKATNISEGHGGGVLIATKCELDAEELVFPEIVDLEAVCVKVALSNCNLFIVSSYIQPASSIEIYAAHLASIDAVEKQCQPCDISIFCGDWNLPDVDWSIDDDGNSFLPKIGDSQSTRAKIARHVTSHFLERGLYQMCDLKNKSGNVLDLVYTNSPELTLLEKADIPLIPESIADVAHVQIACTIECHPRIFQSNEQSAHFCFRKANYDEIRNYLQNIDFTSMLSQVDINEMVDSFYELLYSLFEEFVPKSSLRSLNRPAWYDDKLSHLKNVRNRQYKKLVEKRQTCPEADDCDFIEARKEFEEYDEIKYNEYISEIASESKKNPKKFWKYVNGKRKENSLPCKITLDNEIATSDSEKAHLFSKFFSSVYENHEPDAELHNYIMNRNDRGNFKVQVTNEAVHYVLKGLDINKGMGPDRVSPIFLRECADHLAEPLKIIYSKSLSESICPDKFKIGQITPIHKSGKSSNARNYRGVNIMPNLAKVMEKIIYNQLKLILTPLLSKQQHGFLSNRNIETNLMDFSIYANEAFEQKKQVDVFYADIHKAFDTVKQPLLIRKLSKYPVSNEFLLWLKSYYENRKQYVRVGNAQSELFNVPSSVGQGTILGPLMFLVLFDDSDDGLVDVKTFNFADDKKITIIVKTPEDAAKLQKAIDGFVNWCDTNSLKLNTSKCKIMTFTHKKAPLLTDYYINDQIIERVYEMRDLGVIMDPKLSFSSHLEHIKQKSLLMLSFVKRTCRRKFNLETAKLLYYSLVRSNVEFASIIWSPHCADGINFIEGVQRQSVIYLNGDYLNRKENDYVLAPYVDRCQELEMVTLTRRRINDSIIFIHKIISGRYDATNIKEHLELNTGRRTLRNPEFIRIKAFRTDYGLFSPFNMACRAFNIAALFIDPTIPLNQFKSRLIGLSNDVFKKLYNITT